MRKILQNATSELESHLPQLKMRRATDAFTNDLFEAADYWCHLGHRVLQGDTRVNYPERVKGELALLSELELLLQKKGSERRADYQSLLSIGRKILQIVGTVQMPKDGHLGFLRIVRESFQFVQASFGFSVTEEEPIRLLFSSGAVYLELECSNSPYLSCLFGPESSERKHFWIDDLLFMYGDQRYRTIPEKLAMSTESEVEAWFRYVAEVFKEYGNEVLSNQLGIFDRLAQAQAERDAEFVAAMDEKYGKRQ